MLDQFRAALLSVLAAIGLSHPSSPTYQGYVEGEFVLAAPQIAGTLETLNVERGQTVHKGDLLFTLDHEEETAAFNQAQAQVDAAKATLADLLKGQRPPEIDTLTAQRDQAKAALELAVINYERDQKEFKVQAVSKAALDTDKATLDQARAHLAETEADVATGRQSTGREDAIFAARANVEADQAALAEAEWRLDQKKVTATADAFVFDTLERPGEFIPAGQPVVSLLPPPNIRARFFVPEPKLASVPMGTAVEIHCNGCVQLIPAHVTYVSPQAEYSPPELFNQDNRARLIFMLEATPDAYSLLLHPGQPVDVIIGNGNS